MADQQQSGAVPSPPELGGASSRYLGPEDLRKVSGYRFAPRSPVEGFFSGGHRSKDKGSSTEFRDYRQYTPGDDPSKIDWRVYARNDRFYLRNFHQETSVNCYIFLDSSASMNFGGNFGGGMNKLEFASRFAAALSYLVMQGGDLAALFLFDGEVRFSVPPGSTRTQLHRILRALENNQPGNDTSLAHALRKAGPMLKQRGSVVVLSDFFDDAAAIFDALNSYLHRGFKIYLFQILAPSEMDLPDVGLAAYRDLETGQRVVAHSRDIRQAYQEAMEEHIRNLRNLARRRQIYFQSARTDLSYFSLFDPLVTRPR
jgi:uncharacterized protein (DUF58 family)